MTHLLREFEFNCLLDLIPHIPIQQKWVPLYKSWIQNEFSEDVNIHVTKIWIENIHQIKQKIYIDGYWLLSKYTKNYPNDIQEQIKHALRLSGRFNLD
jgi:hypothetical protein